MPSTHTSLLYHLVYSTKGRELLIDPDWQTDFFSYIGGIVRSLDGTALQVGGMPDHVHILMGLRSRHCLADVVREIKTASSKWGSTRRGKNFFAWQEGYGCFTVSRSKLEEVREYVATQEEHHRDTTFQDEYRMLLNRHDIDYDEGYLW